MFARKHNLQIHKTNLTNLITRMCRMKRIEIIENSVEKVRMQNMRLDKEIAELQTNIDDKRSTSQYLLHETELIARNERYYQSPDISSVISFTFRVQFLIFIRCPEWKSYWSDQNW